MTDSWVERLRACAPVITYTSACALSSVVNLSSLPVTPVLSCEYGGVRDCIVLSNVDCLCY